MTHSFSMPVPSDGWVALTKSTYNQYRTKRLLGLTEIRIEMDVTEVQPRWLHMQKEGIKKAVVTEDAQSQKYYIDLTL